MMTDTFFKVFNHCYDVLSYYLRKPFIGKLGNGARLKRGVKIVGNPYRVFIGANFKVWENSILTV